MMFTRGLIDRTYGQAGDYSESATMWPAVPGEFVYGGSQPLVLPSPGSSGTRAMDPSDPRTWVLPVRWT
jgi:hypothetical protein